MGVCFRGDDDLSGWVDRFRFRHGANIWTNKRGWSLIKARGTAVLENGDGYWTNERLDALTAFTASVDNVAIARASVANWERDLDRRIVTLQLEAQTADKYEDIIHLDSTAAWAEAAILSDTGVVIKPASSWEGWKIDEGVCWCGGKFDFARRFGIHANGLVFENEDGSFGILLPQTDARAPSLTIRPTAYNIVLRGLDSHRRLGWQREGQSGHTLTGDPLSTRTVTFDGTPPRLVKNITGVQIFDVNNRSGTNRKWRLLFDAKVPYSGTWPSDQAFLRWQWGDYSDYLAPFAWTGGTQGNPFEIYRTNTRSAGRLEFYIQLVGGQCIEVFAERSGDDGGLDHHGLLWGERAGALCLAGGCGPDDLLPRMPWGVSSSILGKFEDKMAFWSDVKPVVARLPFYGVQASETAWRQIMALTLGGAVSLDFSLPELNLALVAHPMMKEWRYQAGRPGVCDVHFVAFRAPPAADSGLFDISLDNPLFDVLAANPLWDVQT